MTQRLNYQGFQTTEKYQNRLSGYHFRLKQVNRFSTYFRLIVEVLRDTEYIRVSECFRVLQRTLKGSRVLQSTVAVKPVNRNLKTGFPVSVLETL